MDGDYRAVTHIPRSLVRSVEILRRGAELEEARQEWARALSKLPQADVARHLGITDKPSRTASRPPAGASRLGIFSG